MPEININPSAISAGSPGAASGNKDGTPAPGKPPPLTTTTSQKGNKPAQVSPRVDVEPLYTALKTGIGEHWAAYKDGVSRFVLGLISSSELSERIAPFLYASDSLLHQHNQLILALCTNLTREAPEPGVAPWVSANDKPSTASKPLAGDDVQTRLKHEVMQLPPRVRARMKATNDDPVGPLTAGLSAEAYVRRLPVNSGVGGGVSTPLTAVPPSAASNATGLTKDQEIRKRYQQNLMQETQDLPSRSAISDRYLPIAYEEGLLGDVPSSQSNVISGLMSAALTTFVKESLSEWLSVMRTNPPVSDPLSGFGDLEGMEPGGGGGGGGIPGIYTASYKKRTYHEAFEAARGHLKRNEVGLLPTEVQSQKRANYGRGVEGDARLAWDLRAPRCWGSMVPWAGEKVSLQNNFDEDEETLNGVNGVNGVNGGHRLLNGIRKSSSAMQLDGAGSMVNGDTTMTNHDREDEVAIDEADWGWEGMGDPMALDDLLDGCLNV